MNKFVYISIFVIGGLLQFQAVKEAYIERGRFLIGGEWLIIPLFLLLYCTMIEVANFFEVVKRSSKNAKGAK